MGFEDAFRPTVDTEQKFYTYRDLSTLGRILDFIQRPSYAAMNILEEIQNPERRTAGEIFAPLWKPRLAEEVKGRGRELWEDVEGMPEWLKTVAGLGTEIVADPTTWLTFGGATAGARALRQAGKFTKLGRLGQAQAGARAAVSWRIPGLMKDPLVLWRGLPYFKAESKVLKALQPVLKYVSKSAWLESLPEGVRAARELAEEATEAQGRQMARGLGELVTATKGAREAGWEAPDIVRILETAKPAAEEAPDVMETILRATGRELPDIGRAKAVFDMAKEINPNLPADVIQQVAAKYDSFTGLRQAFFQSADVLLSKYAPEEAEAVAQMWVRHMATDDGLKLINKIIKGKKLSPELQQLRDFMFGWAATPEGVARVAYPQTWMPIGREATLAPMGFDQLFRKIARGEGIYEINQAAKSLGFKPIFEDDIAKIAKTVMGDTLQITKKGHYLKLLASSAEKTGLATSDEAIGLSRGWKLFSEEFPDVVRRTTGETKELLSNLYFKPEHLNEVAHIIGSYADPKAAKEFLRYYDKVIGVWKAWTLGPFIPYHFRNDFSDIMWFNFLAGIGSENYPLASRVMRELAERGDYPKELLEVFTKAPITPFTPFSGPANIVGRLKQALGFAPDVDDVTIKQWADAIQQMDLLHKGQHVSETAALTLRGKALAPLKKPLEIGGIREDWGRAAHAIDRLRKGWAGNEVYADVMKYHYDYSLDAMTPFERFLPNRIFFFYRWMRNNIPGSIRNLFEHYGKHSAAAKGIRTIEESAKGTAMEGLMPEWMRERGPIRIPEWLPWIGGEKREPRYFMTSAWWPFAEMAEFARLGKVWEPTEALRPIVERLSPAAKIPIEMGTGQELFYKKPISLYPGQRRELLGVDMPAELAYMARQWRGVTEAERLRRRLERTEGAGKTVEELLRSIILGARTYTFEPEREAAQRFFETIKQMGIVKSEMKREEARGDMDTYNYLEQMLARLTEQADEYRAASNF